MGKFPLERGGGPTWTTGSYDPALNLLYWPTGNPWPDFGGDRPGDNLYTDCILALDADTGARKWYFQFVPHDTHDWDATKPPFFWMRLRRQAPQTTAPGEPQRLLLHPGPDNGQFLRAVPFVKELNWAKGIDDGAARW